MSRPEENAAQDTLKCPDAAPLLAFFASDELKPEESKRVAAHVSVCAECAARLKEERALLEAIARLPQPADRLNPSDTLLSQCRSELSEALDDLLTPAEKQRWPPFARLPKILREFMIARPAWSAALLVFFGIVLGTKAPEWLRGGGEPQNRGQIVRAMPPLTDEQLAKMAVAGINIAPSRDAAPGTVQVQLRAEQPLVLSGSLEDTEVRRVLTYVVENGQRFDPGVRLDCLEALKSVTSDADVRRALLAAARRDENPAIRLKALDALRDSAEDADVLETLLDTLEHDANPGVRVEAVNLLVGSLQAQEKDFPELAVTVPPVREPRASSLLLDDPSVERVVRALEQLTRKDSNRYVRLRSAAALRQIGPREIQ